ncbi:undecaprenyl-diphosphate phosphatase [Stagnihabitans tardus]|uniref:Undecaprenyl-diphosphatase n=1 Tax=Stagnihabitans tardus TaxID=2699202 RepID=A0AAE5BTS0_9RHOB|nr:undecaprenyl-diphosphate phosphatase [Stagnihabitans tardus]NBZ86497.1 undecaprenyl-diphosphate phosphatase [Stagnihabitans tardus]
MTEIMIAALLGLIEGLTEFIPVSSTGHLLLVGHFLGFSASKTFEVFIQLGPVLAIAWVYREKLIHVFGTAHREETSRRFIVSVVLAFLPAMLIGALAHDFIKSVLFETPRLIATMLVLGGIVLLFIDRIAPEETVSDAGRVPFRKALAIGFIQCLAMVPGVSRSGATIVGARMLGLSKRASAEFSFFLSLPTMLGAVSYDLVKTRHELDFSALAVLAVGFFVAMVAGGLVVKWLLGYVSTKGYALFGWWRIILGLAAFALLSMGA